MGINTIPSQEKIDAVMRMQHYIAEHIKEPITQFQLARAAGYSEYYAARIFKELTEITRGADLEVERVRIKENRVAIEGNFELPPLARLTLEDQIFVTAFVRSQGSIKSMEKLFGISYPTVKNRLNNLSDQFEFVETCPLPSTEEILIQLERGEISATDAIERLSK